MLLNLSMLQFLCYKNGMGVTGLLQRLKGMIYMQALYKVQPVCTGVWPVSRTQGCLPVMETPSLFLLPLLSFYERGPPGKGKQC